MASRGISLVYKLGGEELQGALLRQLVGVLGGDKGAAPGGGAKVTGGWRCEGWAVWYGVQRKTRRSVITACWCRTCRAFAAGQVQLAYVVLHGGCVGICAQLRP